MCEWEKRGRLRRGIRVPQAREEGKGTGTGRGVHCSPAKAPIAFLMSSALSKSVIDILQLFERAEQVRKD